ncbi:SIR2 family protein [Massilia litorea]|jgi:hypothetical protein|uniref:SIR2 family protein n=1 Tax=Massilia litorea TaxID=2769491 RepID=A0A7L9UDI9_9BURK|nr:SIR2 family protein [Massilia litorea]QOL52292.1 SIR2 family protein [Massilia litorea]
MLDPVSAIAFEIQSSKGVFALLLGSGVSFTSKIPTGWAITLDLVRKIAALQRKDCGDQPEVWYLRTFGKAPDYSDMLDLLGSTPSLRQTIIRQYIEPSDAKRARKEKLPTLAHRAIAKLMEQGYVQVVLTTNFDRLLELALADLGVHPTVLSAAEHVAGAQPLTHAGPTIIKLHGDYLDIRIRNTSSELAHYEPEMDELLDRVLDEYGLIVCGWSAEWDVALKAAIERAPSRRYPMYFSTLSSPGAAAQSLVQRRSGRIIQIAGADSFFDEVAQKVETIEDLRKPHPVSAQLAVALMKEYMPEPKHRIHLHDLVAKELAHAAAAMSSADFRTDRNANLENDFVKQTLRFVSLLDTLIPMAYTAGMWASEEQALQWFNAIVAFSQRPRDARGGYPQLVELQAFPAVLILYAFGVGAIVGKQHALLGKLLSTEIDTRHGNRYGFGRTALGDGLNIELAVTDGDYYFKLVPGCSHYGWPGNELIADVLRPHTSSELLDDEAFDIAFSTFELALTFGYVERHWDEHAVWPPRAHFAEKPRIAVRLIAEWEAEAAANKETNSLRLMAGLVAEPHFDQVRALVDFRH